MKEYFNAFYHFDAANIESYAKTAEQAIDDIYDYHMSNYAYTLEIDGDSVRKIDLMPRVREQYPLTAWEIDSIRGDDMRKEC